jgi:MtN3 and saliva related transmembrane protein
MELSPDAAIEAIGFAAAITTTLCWLPQAVRLIRTRDTQAISLSSYGFFSAGIALWLIYGLLIGNAPMIAANTVTLALTLVIVAMKLRYG